MGKLRARIEGLVVVEARFRTDTTRVVETRILMLPDGSQLIARRRKGADGGEFWTAEVPLDIAKEIYSDD